MDKAGVKEMFGLIVPAAWLFDAPLKSLVGLKQSWEA